MNVPKKLFNSKRNLLTDKYIYSCLIKDCDFVVSLDMPTFNDLSIKDKVNSAAQRDSAFESHLLRSHGFMPLFKTDYSRLINDWDTDGDTED